MGIALDYSSEILVADVLKGFEDDVTVPIVWVLDNTGSLLSWNIAYRKGIKEGTAKLENLRTAFEAASEDGPNCVPIFTASSSVSSKALSPSSENKPLVISSTQPAFGQSSTFGQSGFLPTESKSAFGQSSFAKFAPTSKETNSKSTFGQSGFGQNSFASKSGTSSPVASGTTASQSAFGAFSSSGSAFGNQNQSAFSSFATAASTSSSPFATAVSTSSSPFATVASTSSSPFATATSTSSSPFATATSTSTSPFATATSKSTSPFATVTSTSTSPFATVAAGKSPSSLFASTGAPSSFGTDSTTLTSNTTSIFNSGANKSAFGADRTTESIFGASNVSTGSAFGGNKDSNSAFPTSSDAGTSLFTNKASASDSFRTLPTDVDDENEDEAWVDEEDFEDEERDATNQPFGFSGLKLNDSKPVLNQNNPLSLFSSDQLKSNPFGSSSGNFLSTGKSKSGNYSNLFGSSNNKTVESKPSKNVAESAPLPPDPVKPVAESAPLPPDPVKTVAESAPLPPDPVKSVAESAPLPPDPVKSVAESAPLPPDPTSLKETATIKDSETSPRSSSSSSGVLVYASSSPESDAVVIDKSSDSTSKGPKTGLFSIHDATPTKAKNSGFTSIHDVDSSKSDNSKEDHSEKAFNPFEALKTAEDQQVEKGPVEDSENPESFKGSESFDESGPEEIEVKDDSASFDKVLDEIDDPYVKAYLKKKLVKELSQDDLQVLEDHDAPPIEYIQMSTQFPEPQKYTIEDYYYEPVNIEDSECDDELVSYKQYTIPKYYAFDPSVLPAVGDSYESEAINLFSEINAHYEILALNSKAISRVIDLNKPEADEDGVLITREAHTDDDLERFNEWKVSEAAEVKSLWEPIQKEVNELKKTLDIKIDNKVEKFFAKITTDLAEINKAIQYHETFLTDEHVSLGGLPARAALLQTELRKNLKKVKDELSSAEQKVAAVKSASNCGGVTINSLQNFIQKLSLGILNQHNIVEDITKRLNYFQINGGPNRSLLVGTDNKSLLLADEANNSFSFFDTNDDSVLIRRKAMLDSEKVSIVEYKQRQFARKKLSQALKVRDMRSLINSKSTLRGSRK